MRVAVAMSGGLDSAIAAHLLHKQGHQITGVFMRNWEDSTGQCRHEQHWRDVERVCRQLEIPSRRMNFTKEYWHDVFEPFLDGYRRGITPNPDIDCNAKIKFGHLLNSPVVAEHDFLATGHYCIVKDGRLFRGTDPRKDQSYFLCKTSQDQLKRCIFPLGGMLKSDVRALARQLGWHNLADKKESMGICFVENQSGNSFTRFIDDYVGTDRDKGSVVEIESGKIIGEHCGLHSLTIGQRFRSSTAAKKLFVVDKDVVNNSIIVSANSRHPLLYPKRIQLHEINWISGFEEHDRVNCVNIRHNDDLVTAKFVNNNVLKLNGDAYAPAAGQTIAFYDEINNECLGGGTIFSTK